MQPAAHVLLVAAVATVVVIGRTLTEPPEPAPASTPAPTATAATKPVASSATVAKAFGASVRAAPSWEAAGLYNIACGTAVPVASASGGWVKVRTVSGVGWVAASRVVVGSGPSMVDCVGARFVFQSGEARTFVSNGCLSLRSRPSREGPELACVGSGHVYAVVDGPFDPGSGEDWFRVSSPTTGTGWVLADNLYPL